MTDVSPSAVLTIRDASALAAIIDAAVRNQKVGRLIDGKVFKGEARNIGDENGTFLDTKTDIRRGYLHITTSQGIEAFWPISALMTEYHKSEFVVGYEG